MPSTFVYRSCWCWCDWECSRDRDCLPPIADWARGQSQGRGRDRRRPVSCIGLGLVYTGVRGKVDKAKLDMLRGRLGEGWSKG